MITMPTIIQVNNKNFKYHDLPLVVHFEEPVESVYYVRNPEQPIKKYSPKLFRIEKKKVEFAIKMKVLPECKHCGRTMNVTKVEPYIHENYRITFQCQNNQCGKDTQTIYYENVVN
jgi:hypothetical protein